jgi:hypothetical protein
MTHPPETEAELLRGWPFTDHLPLRIGAVEGIPWAIARGGPDGMSMINGYARIPWEGHPWTGCTDYNELDVEVHGGLTYGPLPERDMQKTIDELEKMTAGTDHPFVGPDHDIAVRPAITFADVGGWIGFDTGHAWDYWSDEELAKWGLTPTKYPWSTDIRKLYNDGHDVIWTGERVIHEAKKLAYRIALAGRENRGRN